MMRNTAIHRKTADPDMTPMMDIVFIMLIFFVVTASFVSEPGIDVNRSKSHTPPPVDVSDSLTLELLPGYRIRHNGRLIDVWSATSLMKRFHVEHTEKIIAVKLHQGAKHGTLVSVIDHARQAGIQYSSIVVL